MASRRVESAYETSQPGGGVAIKSWTRGVPFEAQAKAQLERVASLPFVYPWVAVMPDVHLGKGSTIGSVVPTRQAIIPAAVGVDIGCGMMALRTSLGASDLPDDLRELRLAIEAAVPHGRSHHGGAGDKGAWSEIPQAVQKAWAQLKGGYEAICAKHPKIQRGAQVAQLGTLGTGNHFIEICIDQLQQVWLMLHSGSRGVGNRIGSYFIELAKKEMERVSTRLPDADLAYLREGSAHFDDYVEALSWAQDYARVNRELMMMAIVAALRQSGRLRPFEATLEAVNCHHNYVRREHHYGEALWVTRKGALSAGVGELGIIPGNMGARSYIVRGRGNAESFHSCSHGAGRVMSRNEAKRRIRLDEHLEAIAGVECRKDAEVIDETPAAYKSIDEVMRAQRDLVEVVHTLKQVVCVKG